MSTASSTGPGKEGFPAPAEGFVLTHLLIVADQDRSREFYRKVMGAEVIRERDPVVLRLSNSWLILNAGGGPTDDKPNVIAAPPSERARPHQRVEYPGRGCGFGLSGMASTRCRVPHRAQGPRNRDPLLHDGSGRSPDRGGAVHRHP